MSCNTTLASASVVDIAQHVRTGKWRAEDVLEACFDRIDERESTIHAWAWIGRERALAAARSIDAGNRAGALCGVPIAVKDVIDTGDMPTSYGSPIYSGWQPAADAACVAALRNAGAVIIGKTETVEFALNCPSKTLNPLDLTRTPGGSSSGSAAAVSDRMVPAAIGTQTGGSTIRPASFCGIVGYKPSFGQINRSGVKSVAESFDTLGLFARSVPDVALVAAAIAGWPTPKRSSASTPPRIGVCRTDYWDEAEDSAKAAVTEAAQRFGSAGADVREVNFPHSIQEITEAHKAIMAFEARHAFAYELRTNADMMSPQMRSFLDSADTVDRCFLKRALKFIHACRFHAQTTLFSDDLECDILLAPSAAGEAPADLTTTGSPNFNFVWTTLHLPCLNIPGMDGPAGMPVGVQLVGQWLGDEALLAASHWAHDILCTKQNRL